MDMPRQPLSESRGLRISEVRKASGYTQEEVAEALETSQATVARYETGFTSPNSDTILKLARLFGVPPAALFEEGDGLSDEERELIDYLRTHPRERRVLTSTYKSLRGDTTADAVDQVDQ